MLLHRIANRLASKYTYTFCLFWIVTFVLYLPAAKAGFVSDTTGWFQSLTEHSFIDYINRNRFAVKSMYQLTQLNTWVIYKIIGTSHWGWHLVHVTLHAWVCLLLYKWCNRLFEDSGLEKPYLPALSGALLFCISPYASEVVVWEASFHYLQALLFIFGILLLVQRFQQQPAARYALGAGCLFFLSTFTHELFYLTPLLTLGLIIYYRLAVHKNTALFKRSILFFTLPQAACFIVHLLLFRVIYGGGIAHLGDQFFKNPPGYFLVKPPWCFFHVWAWGRFFPPVIRKAVYDVFRTPGGAIAFYGLLALICTWIVIRFGKMNIKGRLISYLFICLLMAQAILMPLWFPEDLLLLGDRYLYLMLAFHAMLLSLLIGSVRRAWLQQGLWLLCACISIYWTLNLSKKWQESEQIISSIQTSSAIKPGKVKLVLNSPACLQGVPMIGATPEGEFRLMHHLFFQPGISDSLLEVAAYNMITPDDGAHVEVVNDSTLKVTLNQFDARWWRNGNSEAVDYENEWYRFDLREPGHWYYLVLKKPATTYDLLYQKGKDIKVVDMAIKGSEQF